MLASTTTEMTSRDHSLRTASTSLWAPLKVFSGYTLALRRELKAESRWPERQRSSAESTRHYASARNFGGKREVVFCFAVNMPVTLARCFAHLRSVCEGGGVRHGDMKVMKGTEYMLRWLDSTDEQKQSCKQGPRKQGKGQRRPISPPLFLLLRPPVYMHSSVHQYRLAALADSNHFRNFDVRGRVAYITRPGRKST